MNFEAFINFILVRSLIVIIKLLKINHLFPAHQNKFNFNDLTNR
jgi:hypothetical protein